MENENAVDSISNNNTKIVFLASIIFLIIVSISTYSYFKTKNLNQPSELGDKTTQNLNDELSRMSAELDTIRAGRPTSTQVSLKEQVKSMDELRKSALKQQTSNITTEEQQKELERLKSNPSTN